MRRRGSCTSTVCFRCSSTSQPLNCGHKDVADDEAFERLMLDVSEKAGEIKSNT